MRLLNMQLLWRMALVTLEKFLEMMESLEVMMYSSFLKFSIVSRKSLKSFGSDALDLESLAIWSLVRS